MASSRFTSIARKDYYARNHFQQDLLDDEELYRHDEDKEETVADLKSISGIRDNHQRGSIGEFLRGRIKPNTDLSFVSAYFTIYAYDKMKTELDGINHLRFLFGEPSFIHSLDPEKDDKKRFRIEEDTLELANKLEQKRVARECAQWLADKTEIRSIVKPGFLHGKMYHINDNGVSSAIIGSSNFTVSGLGLGNAHNNVELNLEVKDDRDRDDLKNWFEEVWENTDLVADVKAEVLQYLEQLYVDHPPEFIYFKTLYHLFEEYLKNAEKGGLLDAQTGFYETKVWNMLYDFQKDGVKGAINKIQTHNGCIIADSVGLGKTFEALAVIKYYEKLNERVLVLCPKKLEENWRMYSANDTRNPLNADRFSYDIHAHTDLGLDKFETVNWGNYGLVVIDESHNFRNNAPGKTGDDGSRRLSRYEFLMRKILQSGVDTKVLLLSATPVNNNLKDLRNQIYLITQDNDRAFSKDLNISSISQTMKNAQQRFSKWADPEQNRDRKVDQLLDVLDSGFFTLLDELSIARSRKHIENYYDIEKIGKFPERLKPIALAPNIDTKGFFKSYDELYNDISQYKLSLYNPSAYLLKEHMQKYAETEGDIQRFNDQKTREHYLIGMMRVNFLKRLESSIESFEISMKRTIERIDERINKITHFEENREEFLNPELFDMTDDEDLEDLQEQLSVGRKLKFQLAHLDIDQWLQDLRADKKQLIKIHEAAAAITPERDNKLQELKRLIRAKVENPINPANHKVVVFSAFADTASYLYTALKDWARAELGLHIALVTGTGDNKTTFKPKGFQRQTNFDAILTNFSPRSKMRAKIPSMPQEGEIDILIASDCISEGQNLQDCDYLVNYDIHWNPVRIIQRFGRIDRLNSINKKVQLVNFWPTTDLNKYINLKDRVEARMTLVDITATGEDDMLNNEQIKELVGEDLTYRDKQLLRLKDEIIDLEDMEDNVSLSEFTLDDFRIELTNYLENNKQKLEDAPLGLYALTPTLKEMRQPDLFDSALHEIVQPGVIFCLRHKKAANLENEKDRRATRVSPLNPYYLLYCRADGEVRFSFMQPKQILTIYQALCQGQDQPFQELCDQFNRETDNGRDMTRYDQLLQKAVNSITHTFRRRAASGLQSGRDAVIPDQSAQARDANDFELVTWLVIKAGDQSDQSDPTDQTDQQKGENP